MPGFVNPGSTHTWPANVELSSIAYDATDLTLTVRDPLGGIVAGFPVALGGLVHDGLGQYHYDWTVDSLATPGTYTADWAGHASNGRAVSASDSVDVRGAMPAPPPPGGGTSDIDYPHLVTILRAYDSGALDGWGRPVLTAFLPTYTDVPAWVQQLGTVEQQLLSQAGERDVTHRIFMDPTDISEADMLRWDAGHMDFELVDVTDPDGTGDHLQITAHERVPVPTFGLVS